MVCLGGQQNMGSTPGAVKDDDGGTPLSPEEILKLSRSNRKPLVIIPRSRSPSDLPGGIRVPVLKKTESRLKTRLEANTSSLEELKVLKEKYQAMVNDVTRRNVRSEHSQLDHMFHKGGKRTTSASSFGSLSSISEEGKPRHISESAAGTRESWSDNNDDAVNGCLSKMQVNYEGSDRSISPSDKRRSYSSTCSSAESQEGEMTLDYIQSENEFENERKTPESSASLRSTPSYPRDTSVTLSDQRFLPRRRASVQCVQNRTIDTPMGLSCDSEIRPIMRRASIQCEAIMTKQRNGEATSKFLSEIKLHCNGSGPLRAVMKQYGSSAKLKTGDVLSTESVPRNPTTGTKDPREVLRGWLEESKRLNSNISHETSGSTMIRKPPLNEQETSKVVHIADAVSLTPKHGCCGNIREHSFTSDYYGSVETINSVQSLPSRIPLTPRGQALSGGFAGGSPGSHKYLQTRRHSLPINSFSDTRDAGHSQISSQSSSKGFVKNSVRQRLFRTVAGQNANACRHNSDDSSRRQSFADNVSICSDEVFKEMSGEDDISKTDVKQGSGHPQTISNSKIPEVYIHTHDEGYEDPDNDDATRSDVMHCVSLQNGDTRFSDVSSPDNSVSKQTRNTEPNQMKPLLETAL